MKTLTTSISMIFLLFAALTVQAQTGSIQLTINQLEPEKGGILKIGLFESKGFPIVGEEIVGSNIEVKEASITHTFTNLSAGIYAISIFQDANDNGQIDKNFFGAPTEPYGFSTNTYGMFGPPDFADVSFEVKDNETVSLTINLE